ncbi:MAG TPA: PH domain-containing protein [Clostridia bacterium]|jgi:hypothetical protein|nr:MAG: hypothetical protein BWX97_01195 [Firmicutes bacterium ADurb.Bin146]HOD93152.1 PH domain-containing protein [Clostridia bacterium]HQM39051.1 PH domain-containing protein [Clostridia bacterium]
MEKKELFKKNKVSLIITIVLVVAIAALLIFSKVNVITDGQTITIKSALERVVIDYDNVMSVEKADSINVGSRVMGADLIKIYSGTFKNDEYGRYKLYIYKDIKDYIVIQYENGFVVINQKTEELTDQLYKTILDEFANR